jgi:hypothetical protein
MKKKRFSVEQIVDVLKQPELGVPVAEVIRKVGISEQTFYRWKKQYVGMETVHRCGVLSAESRAGQYKYFDIEDAAATLHGLIDGVKHPTPRHSKST